MCTPVQMSTEVKEGKFLVTREQWTLELESGYEDFLKEVKVLLEYKGVGAVYCEALTNCLCAAIKYSEQSTEYVQLLEKLHEIGVRSAAVHREHSELVRKWQEDRTHDHAKFPLLTVGERERKRQAEFERLARISDQHWRKNIMQAMNDPVKLSAVGYFLLHDCAETFFKTLRNAGYKVDVEPVHIGMQVLRDDYNNMDIKPIEEYVHGRDYKRVMNTNSGKYDLGNYTEHTALLPPLAIWKLASSGATLKVLKVKVTFKNDGQFVQKAISSNMPLDFYVDWDQLPLPQEGKE